METNRKSYGLVESSKMLGVTYRFLYDQVRSGKVESIRIGAKWLITKAQMDKLVGCK